MPCRGNVSDMFCDSGRRCETLVSKVAVAGRTGSLTEMGLKSRVGRLEK